MKRIKVLHFTKVINREDFIDVVIRNANTARFEMLACSYDGLSNIEDPAYEENGVPYFKLNITHGWWQMFLGAWRLGHILRSHNINIIHTHHYYEAVIGRLACWLAPSCKHVIGRHYHDQFYLTTKGFKLWYYLKVESLVNRWANAIIVPSTAIVELLKRQGTHLRKVFMIPYCFNFDAHRYGKLDNDEVARLKKEMGWEGKWVIGNIGRHHIIKGQSYLLQAFPEIKKTIPNALLVMIGDGPYHQSLVEEVKRLGLESDAQFLGWRKDAHRLINAMNLVVHPTLQEAFPQLMVEVMAVGVPLVITPVSGATDVILHRENGLLIPFKNSAAICDAVVQVCNHPTFADNIGLNASQWVRQNLSINKIIPKYEEVYERAAR